jgi:5-keto 4-deoxyuronate isomerase
MIEIVENKTETIWDIVKKETGKACQVKCNLLNLKNENNQTLQPNHVADNFTSYFFIIN